MQRSVRFGAHRYVHLGVELVMWLHHRAHTEGFTLVEIAIGLVIVASLMSIALVSFRGAQRNADRDTAKLMAARLLLPEQSHFADWNYFTPNTSDLSHIPEGVTIKVAPAASTSTKEISVAVGDAGTLVMAVYAPEADVCVYKSVTSAGALSDGVLGTPTPCNAALALPAGESLSQPAPRP